MPIINCPDCNSEMSDAAPACPKCGRPNANVAPEQRSVGIILGIGIAFIPLLFSWFTLRKGYSTLARVVSFSWLVVTLALIGTQDREPTPRTSTTSTATEEQAEQIISVGIGDILSSYENNEIAADNKFKGKLVRVAGIISNVKKDILGSLYVTLGTGAQFQIPEVQAFFGDSQSGQLGQLRKGQTLTVVCRVDGLMMNVLAKDCTIEGVAQ